MEYWDIYDEHGKFTGKKRLKGTSFNNGEYHFAIEAWLINDDNELLIQKRSANCEILPGIWALTTGRITAGENTLEGCIREVQEELGITVVKDDIKHLRRFKREENHLIWDIFLIKNNTPVSMLSLQKNEVAAAKWVSIETFRELIQNENVFIYAEIKDVLTLIEQEIRHAISAR